MAVFESETVQDDLHSVGESAAGGLARMFPQRLFGYSNQ